MNSTLPHAKRKNEHISRSTFIVVISFLLAGAAIVSYVLRFPDTLTFRFNPYGILSLAPLGANLWIIYQIVRLRAHSEEAVWFVLYMCAVTIASFAEGLQRFSVSPEAVVFWFKLNGIGFMLLPISYYLFVFSYARPLRSQSPLLISGLLVSAFVMMMFFVGTNNFYDLGTLVHYPWGYNPHIGHGFFILFLWVEILFVVALLTLIYFYRSVTSDLLKRQSGVYIFAILIPMVGGSITDGLLPLVGVNTIVPLSTFLSAGTGIVAYYGLRKYRLFQINPVEFATNVIRTMHEAVIVTDRYYKIDFMNREAERLIGIRAAELAGKDISTQFTPESWQILARYQEKGEEELSTKDIDELKVINQRGERIPVSVYTSRLVDGPNEVNIFIIADISDITQSYHQLEASTARIKSQNDQLQENQVTMERLLGEAKDLQQQLQHEKENVEHTVQVRTAELREARDKLKASDELKSEFIMLSSHNLRTPLAIMQSSVEMLAGNGSNGLSPEQKTMVKALESSTQRLGEFVEDLLTIATLEAGDGISLSPTTLKEVIEPLLSETKSMAAAKGLTYNEHVAIDGIMVSANTMRLRGAIRNLMHNAVNYTQKGEISLRIYATDTQIHIVVKDTGMGIPPDELPNLFTKFHRATSVLTYDYQGVGIGLYLTKLVVEEHNGKISVDSRVGVGSTFSVVLPRFNPQKN